VLHLQKLDSRAVANGNPLPAFIRRNADANNMASMQKRARMR
jgi:hypothetical protein